MKAIAATIIIGLALTLPIAWGHHQDRMHYYQHLSRCGDRPPLPAGEL